ncbi:hypothetical protein DLD77_02365 [Chitinophaga alhagiae]|uniref:Major tropism determinant N-terminal domain-containing protein n=1 Tax=Chitinophaga alhagiae TaxID=2203219 RepID=A0ABM6W9G9_9BACT|nr:hypothetical protein DLD77_02365 [Chitinophaga alhagiae]
MNNAALAAHPLDTAAAGMMVFNTNDQGLYIKKQNGLTPWTRLNDGGNLSLAGLSDALLAAPADGQLLKFESGKWVNWAPNYITPAQTLTFSDGDVTGSGALSGSILLSLANLHSGGTHPKVTYNEKGLVTGGSALAAADVPAGSTHYIQNQTGSQQTSAGFNIDGGGAMKALTVRDMDVNGGILFTSGTGGAVAQDAGQLVWVAASNELGIGTANPDAKLDVNGDFKLGTSGSVLASIQKTSVTFGDNTQFDYNTARNFTVTLPAGIVLKNNDNIIINPRSNLPVKIGIAWCRVTNAAARQITVSFTNTGNNTAVGSREYDITIIQD